MAYHLYTTDAFVIDSYPLKEADTFFILFTRDLGMIQAVATGSKKIDSKLRYNLKDYSLTSVSLIRGKASWKIVGAAVIHDCVGELRANRAALEDFTEVVSFVRRMVPGEAADEGLFSIISDGYRALRDLSSGPVLKELILLRIVSALGYSETASFGELVIPSVISKEMIDHADHHISRIKKSIERSVAASQL
jgi:recombinational DNA repair protein (RecF pathway)